MTKLRAEAGQAAPADLDEEDRLRSSVKSLQDERDRLADAHEELAKSILDVAVHMPASTSTPSTTPGAGTSALMYYSILARLHQYPGETGINVTVHMPASTSTPSTTPGTRTSASHCLPLLQ